MAKQFKIGYLPLTKANWTNETLEAARREARAYLQSLPGVEVVGGDRMIDFEEKRSGSSAFSSRSGPTSSWRTS